MDDMSAQYHCTCIYNVEGGARGEIKVECAFDEEEAPLLLFVECQPKGGGLEEQ